MKIMSTLMKKKILKTLVVGSLVSLFSYGFYVYGCAGDWLGSGYTSIFSPEITVNNKHYEPFFISVDIIFI